MNVLVLNAGSSALKFELIRTSPELITADQDERLCRGTIEGIGGEARASIEKSGQAKNCESVPLADVTAALEYIAGWLSANGFAEVNAVGHRVVHGGELFSICPHR